MLAIAWVLRAIAFLGFYLWGLLISSLRVAHDVLTPTFHMRPRVIDIPLDVKSEGEITLLANLVSLSPGSLTLDVSPDRRTLRVHVMYADDTAAAERGIKHGIERRIMALFSTSRY
jgi:multicomponent Na+:H+ antiporter subunit E